MPIPTLSKPPGEADSSYVLPLYGGELWTIPTSNSVMRLLVTAQESKGDFAVVSTGGQEDSPIGFHYHREAHDVFLCLKGSMNVWADDQSRTLYPGDFASVPPKTIHQYQILGSHTEFAGLIIPGGWEEFFRFVGEPYQTTPSGPLFPTRDHRNPLEVLVPKLIAATEKFDMIPAREHKGADPIPCAKSDSILPDAANPYFLKASTGPRYASAGLLVKPLARTAQTNGKFSIAKIEGSEDIKTQLLGNRNLKFTTSHHAFLIDSGSFSFTTGGEKVVATEGETIFVPAGLEFGFTALGRYSGMYAFTNGGGIIDVLVRIGKEYASPIIAEDFPTEFDVDDELKNLEQSCGFAARWQPK